MDHTVLPAITPMPASILPHKHSPDGASPDWGCAYLIAAYLLLIYLPQFTHISGHPSTAGRAQDRESSPVKDRRSTNCATQPTMSAWHSRAIARVHPINGAKQLPTPRPGHLTCAASLHVGCYSLHTNAIFILLSHWGRRPSQPQHCRQCAARAL